MSQRGPDEFGDFQTPQALAIAICRLLSNLRVQPATVMEPTCGRGGFLLAALDQFLAANCFGVEINPFSVEELRAKLTARNEYERCQVRCENFYDVDWRATCRALPEPLLILGNPPWVTNAQLGALGSTNLPQKSNFQRHTGLDAITGKSNFDISEWMLIRLLESLVGHRGWLAMLCRTAVARKVLSHAWKTGIPFDWAEMRLIDAGTHFAAAVDACLLVCAVSPGGESADCNVFSELEGREPSSVIGWRNGQLLANVRAYERWMFLEGDSPYQWRSGVKHDCSKVMELKQEGTGFRNGHGELVDLEDEYVYPLLKSSDVANGRIDQPARWMIVPQRTVGQETAAVRKHAPKTWAYLERHGVALDGRASSIYRYRPRFSVFGIGNYTFAPWKVAISGFFKRLAFIAVGSSGGKPTVFDDTVYFVPCQCEREARFVTALLNHESAQKFFSAFVFWDAKRPITVDLLRRLNLRSLARQLGREDQWPAVAKSLFETESPLHQSLHLATEA